jgi:type VI secretion system protein ImpA
MGQAAPALHALQAAVDECTRLAKDFFSRSRPLPGSVDDITGDGLGGVSGGGGAGPGTRTEVYRQLRQAAVVLRKLEPHSPVPYIIERAIALGDLPFPEMIRRLIRDTNALTELNRELGLSEAGSPSSDS